MPPAVLSENTLRALKPAAKPYRRWDRDGLYAEVSTTGRILWRMKYRWGGKEKRLSIGIYPAVSLAMARDLRDKARGLMAQGIDPSAHKQEQARARVLSHTNTFQLVAGEWLEKQKPKWSAKYWSAVHRRLEKNVYPRLGNVPVSDIKPAAVLDVLRRIEARGANYMAGRCKESISAVMCYAVATLRAEADPTLSLKGALTPHPTKHMASVTDPQRVGEILRAFDAFTGTSTVRTALFLAPYVFARPGELRQMRWADLDLKAGLWCLDRGSMKMRRDHIVPLSTQAVALIEDMRPESGHLEYVFAGARDPKRPMSDAAVNAGLRRLGISTEEELTGHGFRAMARTILRERLKFDAEVIECQLSHSKGGALGGAYDRTEFLDERIVMMQRWADCLDDMKAGKPISALAPARDE